MNKAVVEHNINLLALLAAIIFAGAWIPMLALGVLHSYWPAIPAFGYWETVIVYFGAGVLRGLIKGPSWK